jgi:hypothetical protein
MYLQGTQGCSKYCRRAGEGFNLAIEDFLWLAMVFKAFPIVSAINTQLWAAMKRGLLQPREDACILYSTSFTCDHM